MNHHRQGPECPLCNEKLLTAHPRLVQWYKSVKSKYPNLHVSWAWRGMADQNKFVAEKKSNALWPTSPHNAMRLKKPCSKALDLFQIDDDGNDRWVPIFFAKLNAENIANLEPLVWGGDFKKLGDSCHFQLTDAAWAC